MKLAAGGSISTNQTSSERRIETYLATLRGELSGLSAERVLDIVEELRVHIREKSATGGQVRAEVVEAILLALGSPYELAEQYLADDLLERAKKRRSPILLIRGLAHWASMSAAGMLALFGCLVGYLLGGSFLLAGFLKPIHSHSAGLWKLGEGSYSLRLGFGSAPANATELLGWWMLPLGLLLGGGACFLTTQIVLWCAREFRKNRAVT
ncbi:MAG TPA: hypothetical protein VMI10_17190 [Terriglobales bacterium]|nr:hypothetical protein [Terriglobales bacterium]